MRDGENERKGGVEEWQEMKEGRIERSRGKKERK